MSEPRTSPSAGRSRPRLRRLEQWADNGIWTVAIGIIAFAISYPRALEMSTMEPFLKLAVVTLAIAGVLSFALRRRLIVPQFLRVGSLGHGVPWFAVLFLAFAAASVFWSVDRGSTARAVTLYTGLAVIAYLCASATHARALVRGLALGGLLVAAGSLVAADLGVARAYVPSNTAPGAPEVLAGLYGNRNILAYSACLLLPALVTYRPGTLAGRFLHVATAAAMAAFLILPASATGIITGVVVLAAALAVAALGWLARTGKRERYQRSWVRLTTVTIGAGAATAGAGTAVYLALRRVPELLSRDTETLSGRVELWRAVQDVWRERSFWDGLGFGAVWKYHWLHSAGGPGAAEVTDRAGFLVGHGHNGFLDLAIQVGAMGCVLYLAVMVRATFLALQRLRAGGSPGSSWTLVSVVAISALSLTEPVWMTPLGWFLVVALGTVAEREHLSTNRPRPAHARS